MLTLKEGSLPEKPAAKETPAEETPEETANEESSPKATESQALALLQRPKWQKKVSHKRRRQQIAG